MNCKQLEKRLDDYLDSKLDSIIASMIEQHVQSCQNCTNKIQFARTILNELSQNTNNCPHPGASFINNAFAQVRENYPENRIMAITRSNAFKVSFITTVAAGLTLWSVLSLFIQTNNPNIESTSQLAQASNQLNVVPISTLNINLNEIRLVRIAIESPSQFDKVTLSMILPKFIELKGHRNKQLISWQTTLNKGNNILNIPLKAIQNGQGEFVAKIAHKGKTKIFKVYLNTINPDLSNVYSMRFWV